MKEIRDHNEAIDYAELYWKHFFDKLPVKQRDLALAIESRGRFLDHLFDKEVINALEKVMEKTPPFEEDVVIFRGGREEDFCPNRPFLSATFLKKTGEKFASEHGGTLFTIHVRKGSRAIPICAAGMGFRHEQEVVIATRFIHLNGDICEYFEE